MTSLTQVVARFLASWEAQNQLFVDNYVALRSFLNSATDNEIVINFNTLTFNNLWNDNLVDLFYNEIYNRIMDNITFSISTVWKDVETWLSAPVIVIQVGMNDKYAIAGNNVLTIYDENINSFVINNNNFTEENEKAILRLLFIEGELQVGVNINDNKITVSKLLKGEETFELEGAEEEGEGEEMTLTPELVEYNEFEVYKNMIQCLSSNKFVLVNSIK